MPPPHKPRGNGGSSFNRGHFRGSTGSRNRSKRPPSSLCKNDDCVAFLRHALDSPNSTELYHNMMDRRDHVLDPLLNARFSLFCAAEPHSFSFQRVAIGFLELIVSTNWVQITPATRNRFFSAVLESSFLTNALTCLTTSTLRGYKELAASPEKWCRSTTEEALLLVCQAIDRIYERGANVGEYVSTWNGPISLVIGRLLRNSISEKQRQIIDKCQEFLNNFEEYAISFEQKVASLPVHMINLDISTQNSTENSTDNMSDPGPGEFYNPETKTPRHDNDFIDFRQVQILPTVQEIQACIRPWLPKTNTRFQIFRNDTDKILDRNFRLLRHELLYPLIAIISNFGAVFSGMDSQAANQIREQLTRRRPMIRDISVKDSGNESYNASAFYNAQFHSLSVDSKAGLVVTISFDIPLHVQREASQGDPNKVFQHYKSWIEYKASRYLANTSIGLFYLPDRSSYFLLVPFRPPNLKENRVVLECSIPSDYYHSFMNCLVLLSAARRGNTEEYYVFFTNSVFFPTITPLLRGLKRQEIPFSKVFASTDFSELGIPSYLRHQTLNLKPILKNNSLPLSSSVENLSKMIDYIQSNSLTDLDPAQLKSMIHCLQHNLCITNGPPGTGKSFLGIYLIKLLLSQRFISNSLPILLICYTNHALDQLLEMLIENQIVGINDVVKVGTRSESPVVEQILTSKIQNNRVSAARATVSRIRGETDSIKTSLLNFSELRKFDVQYSLIKSITTNPNFYDNIPAEVHLCTSFLNFLSHCSKRDYELFLTAITRRIRSDFPELIPLLPTANSFYPNTSQYPCYHFINEKDSCPDYDSNNDLDARNSCNRSCRYGSHDPAWLSAKSKVCKFYLQYGNCKHGDSCKHKEGHLPRFIRSIDFPVGNPCPFHYCPTTNKKGCDRGIRCQLSHQDEVWSQYKKYFCFHYLQHGHCNAGVKCPNVLGHVPSLTTKPTAEDTPVATVSAPENSVGISLDQALSLQFVDRHLLSLPESALSELHNTDFFDLPYDIRIAMYLAVRAHSLTVYSGTINSELNKISEMQSEMNEATSLLDYEKVQHKKVVGITCSVATKSLPLLEAMKAKIVIIEEAGEVLEGLLLTSLSSFVEHLVLIGDYQQLRPKINTFELKGESNRGFNLDMSLFERLVLSGVPSTSLSTQYRMRPCIADLIRIFYPDTPILDGDKVTQYPPVQGITSPLLFFDHNYPEEGLKADSTGSHTNRFEAIMAVRLALYFMNQGYIDKRITILTPYVGQLLVIRQIMQSTRVSIILGERDAEEVAQVEDSLEDSTVSTPSTSTPQDSSPQSKWIRGTASHQLRVSTVDNYQGEENDIIILSTVRCNEDGRIGFLKFNNRVNVMLSRAKHGMFILGSGLTVEKYDAGQIRRGRAKTLFGMVLDRLTTQGLRRDSFDLCCPNHPEKITRITHPDDFDLVVDGGCDLPCEYRLSCGHSCPLTCHSSDPHHTITQCTKPCELVCQRNHECKKKCFQACQCDYPMKKVLACGHSMRIACHLYDQETPCNTPVEVKLPTCGHVFKAKCHEIAKILDGSKWINCSSPCNCLLSCGHSCQSKCGACTKLNAAIKKAPFPVTPVDRSRHPNCQHKCDKYLSCGHTCNSTVCHVGESCPPCRKPCTKRCAHTKCNHNCEIPCVPCIEPCSNSCPHVQCNLPCSVPCNVVPCQLRCEKQLDCGHQCPSMCGEICPDPSYCQECGSRKEEVVDLIMNDTYAQVDLNETPIIVLSCRHFFTVETLDGWLNYHQIFYSQNGVLVPNMESKSFEDCRCPTCRCPITTVARYFRLSKAIDLFLLQVKHYDGILTASNNFHDLFIPIRDGLIRNLTETNVAKLLNLTLLKNAKQYRGLTIAHQGALAHCSRNGLNSQLIFVPKPLPNSLLLVENSEILVQWYNIFFLVIMRHHLLDKISPVEFPLRGAFVHLKKKFKTVDVIHFDALFDLCRRVVPSVEIRRRAFETCFVHCIQNVINDSFECLKESASEKMLGELFFKMYLGHVRLVIELINFITGSKFSESVIREITTIIRAWATDLPSDLAAELESVLESFSNNRDIRIAELKSVFSAVGLDFGTNFGSQGRYNFCPNMHPYVIGNCGMDNESARCPYCGATIGRGASARVQVGNLDDYIERLADLSVGRS
ncbi:hypothetical protein RCL1_004656 [Eukaryota sp. TZLM3-RCL]